MQNYKTFRQKQEKIYDIFYGKTKNRQKFLNIIGKINKLDQVRKKNVCPVRDTVKRRKDKLETGRIYL